MDPRTKTEKIVGAMLGLLVGDAVGVSYEFKSAGELPPFDTIDILPPHGFQKTYPHVPVGTYSDDGAQALCLLDSLISCGRLDLADFGQRLLRWRNEGLWAVGRHVFDIGLTTQTALAKLANGHPPETSGPAEENACGNGSLMRILPLALWHKGTDTDLVEDAHRSSLPTHGHPLVQACCAFYCLWVRHELVGANDGWPSALATLRMVYQQPRFAAHAAALEDHVLTFVSPQGTGFVVDSLWSARAALNYSRDFGSVTRKAISMGNDTDTTAAIACGIAGLRVGSDAIPKRWIEGMRELDEPRRLIAQLAAL